ncbi:uncharacterized protein [Chironomus tepperi]|uniref:uncharacterized protein isoform X5 n=1 Tax=Chironomus tepperi TaxID=113505 RepID=UPI00391F5D61
MAQILIIKLRYGIGWLICWLLFIQHHRCSEFPDRECCDPVFPFDITDSEPLPPALPTTTVSSSSSSAHQTLAANSILQHTGGQALPGRSGPNVKIAIAILNCILARQLCFEDPSCSAILEIIPRVCGPVPVACSTVTVTKCQAALRTLQAFPFFRPTCLCKEPGVDPDCNYFRDFLFDHPCGFVLKKVEKDPYPVDALPTCNHALSVCQQERKCIKLFEDFKLHCKVRENKCRMEDKEACHEAWTNLRLSPMFGCICPNNHMKRRCDKIFNVVNHNPCVDSDDIETDESHPIHFQSTCHLALDTCRDETSCSTSLQTVLHHCDIDRCNKPACMESLQAFYRDNLHEDLSLDAALCLCRKTSSRHDSCMLAKEKLHPLCAQRPPDGSSTVATTNGAYNMLPACHTLADLCKEDPDCRSRLEFFEQSCAVDSVTKKCAGKMSNCRIALLGIMGTPLRSLCACQGSDLQQLYECLGWQRLLWLNPCVVEAQKDFHLKRLAELGLLITTSTTTTTTQRTTTTTTSTSSTTTTTTPAPIRITFRERLQTSVPQTPPPEIIYHRPASNEDFDTNYIEGEEVVDENFIDDNKDEEFYGITTEMLGMEVATLAPMTTTIETTTIPTRYCVVQRPHTPEQFIPEGQSKRLYIMDDAECSELCSCSAESLALSCHALCVPLVPCRTSLAFYSHTSPAYQAFRGRCLCYSGRFICMRPPPGDYKLPGGVFLLLGYSSTDEALLRPHTNLGVQDAVRALQLYIVQHINNQTQCTLSLFNITDENIILSVRLPYDQKLTTLDMLKREKQFCTSILETVSHQINTEYDELTAHRLLSIFKMAEVQVIWPDLNGAGSAKNVNLLLLIIATFICCTMELSHQMLSSTRT